MALQGISRDVNLHNADSTTGRLNAGQSPSFALANEDKAVLDSISGQLDMSISSLAVALEAITVTGNVAAGAADSGNPVKIGGVYNSTPPTLLNGQRGDLQFDQNGNLRVAPSSNRSVTGTISASGQSVVIDTGGISTVGWDTEGTWVGTIISEISYDGVNWYGQETLDTESGNNFITVSFTEAANNDSWITNVAGAAFYRLRATAWTSGTATINFVGSGATGPLMVFQSKASALNAQVVGAYAAGVTATPKPLIAGGVDGGGVLRYLLTDTSGKLEIGGISGSISLPTGAATAANQATANASLASIDGKLSSPMPVSQSGAWSTGRTWTLGSGSDSVSSVQSGAWSVRNLDGAGTALTSSLVNARQALDIHQADTSFIVSGLTAVGNAPSLNPVSISGIDGGGLKRHFLLDSAGRLEINSITGSITLPTGAATAANQATANASLSSIDGKLNSLGQKVMTGSVPVVIASDQSAVKVNLQDGAGTALTSTLVDGKQSLDVSSHSGNIPTYMASTNGFVLTGTAANTVQSIAYLFHPNTVAERYEISRIFATVALPISNSSNFSFRIARITAENGTPGGTSQTINALDSADAALSVSTVFRTGATGAPTRSAGDLVAAGVDVSTTNSAGSNVQMELFNENDFGKPLVIRASQAEGWEVRTVLSAAGIAASTPVTVTYVWRKI